MKINVRKPRWADVPSLFRVASQAFLENARYPLDSFESLKTSWRYVAEVDGELAGFLHGSVVDGKKNEVWINHLAVHPRHQGVGVGNRLMAAIERDALRAGYTKTYTGTPFALGFYEKRGYAVTRIHYALTKDLIGRDVPSISTKHVRRGDFEDLCGIIEDFQSADRASFLRAFFGVYRRNASHIFVAHTPSADSKKKYTGAIVAKPDSRNLDLIEVEHLSGDDDTRLSLLGHLEYQASKEGTRWIGVRTRTKAFCGKLQSNGYEIAHLPEWWTLYYLHKSLSK